MTMTAFFHRILPLRARPFRALAWLFASLWIFAAGLAAPSVAVADYHEPAGLVVEVLGKRIGWDTKCFWAYLPKAFESRGIKRTRVKRLYAKSIRTTDRALLLANTTQARRVATVGPAADRIRPADVVRNASKTRLLDSLHWQMAFGLGLADRRRKIYL